jgi:hypothetical protein
MDEGVRLAHTFDLSLDSLFQQGEHVLVRKTREIQSFHDLANYLENSLRALQGFNKQDTRLYYSAKDIPLFYTIGNNLLSKFKLFVWLNLMGSRQDEVNFSAFRLQAPLHETSIQLYEFYQNVQVNEIWNDTTINSTLQQIIYFFQSGLLAVNDALELCDSLKELIYSLEQQCEPTNDNYRLYYHELLILNNNVLVNDGERQSLFVPYTMLGYFITDDGDTCRHAQSFYSHQLKTSKLLNTAGKRDKKIFFNRAYQKVEFYKSQIKTVLDFC